MKIFIHLGAEKCASSSIQQYFSHNNVRGKFAYVTLDKHGNLEFDKIIKLKSSILATNYVNSLMKSDSVNTEFLTNLKNSLAKCAKLYNTIFLSGESLHALHKQFVKMIEVLSDYDVRFIMIVRPPVEWLNSSWWQWVNWRGVCIEQWISSVNCSKNWIEHYNAFKSLPYVKGMHLFSMQQNIVEQICKTLKISFDKNTSTMHNVSSSAELLNFFNLKRDLRTGEHDSALEFVLNKYLKARSPQNWVLSQENIEHVLEKTKPYNLELQKIISNEDITHNRAWWDISYYAERISRIDRGYELSGATLADMLAEAYSIIYDLDCELRCKK